MKTQAEIPGAGRQDVLGAHVHGLEARLASARAEADDLRSALGDARSALRVTAGNIRDLGPAGAIPVPYEVWLRIVDEALVAADRALR